MRNEFASETAWRLERSRTIAVSTSCKANARFSAGRTADGVITNLKLRFEHDEQLHFRIGQLARNVNADAARLHDVIPARPGLAHPEILRIDSCGNGGRRHRQMRQ